MEKKNCSIKVKRVVPARGEALPLPERMTEGASGFDLRSDEDFVLGPGERRLVPTGFCFEIPYGLEGQVRPRSGLANRNGITVLNSPGTVDADYRGEVHVNLINHGTTRFKVSRGDRIGQLVVCPVEYPTLVEVDELSGSSRGDGGHGSTGVK